MKNLKIVKAIIMVMVILVTLAIGGRVFAANNTTDNLALEDLSPNTSTSGNNASTTGNNTTGTAGNNAVLNSSSAQNRSNTLNTSAITNNTSNRTNTSNSANTSLPKTGVESAVPVVLIIVICGISAVYAYKKIKDYRNI